MKDWQAGFSLGFVGMKAMFSIATFFSKHPIIKKLKGPRTTKTKWYASDLINYEGMKTGLA